MLYATCSYTRQGYATVGMLLPPVQVPMNVRLYSSVKIPAQVSRNTLFACCVDQKDASCCFDGGCELLRL